VKISDRGRQITSDIASIVVALALITLVAIGVEYGA
jgi:hypothetical protein